MIAKLMTKHGYCVLDRIASAKVFPAAGAKARFYVTPDDGGCLHLRDTASDPEGAPFDAQLWFVEPGNLKQGEHLNVCVAHVTFTDAGLTPMFIVFDRAYLMSDDGKTIEHVH